MKRINSITILVFLLLFSACNDNKGAEAQVSSTKKMKKASEKTLLSPKEFQDKASATENAVIIDVRTKGELAVGYLKDMVHIDFNSKSLKKDLAQLDKDKPYFVYCAAGYRSAKTAELMKDMGFKKVYDMDGGFRQWAGKGLPYVKP